MNRNAPNQVDKPHGPLARLAAARGWTAAPGLLASLTAGCLLLPAQAAGGARLPERAAQDEGHPADLRVATVSAGLPADGRPALLAIRQAGPAPAPADARLLAVLTADTSAPLSERRLLPSGDGGWQPLAPADAARREQSGAGMSGLAGFASLLGGLGGLGIWLLARRRGGAASTSGRPDRGGLPSAAAAAAGLDQPADATLSASAWEVREPQPTSSVELEQAHEEIARLRNQLALARRALDQRQQHELLGRLSGGLGHDLNNLLGVISNSAHLLQRLVNDPSAEAAVAATFRSVETATRLTQQLLQLANGNGTETPVVDLDATLKGMQELLRIAVGKRIEVSLHVAPGTRAPLVDANQLELALLSLLLNARAAMPNGGRVWIDARNATPGDLEGLSGGDHVVLSVSDDGIGMDDDVASRAFEPFFSTRGDADACGLGLCQVEDFCRAAGGRAQLASTPGLGTAVTLLLPARESAPASTTETATGDPDVAPACGSRGRLLLVEDIQELGEVTAALLENYGFSVLRADSAEAALQQLAGGEACDIVLSDIVMSGALDGVDLAHALRERSPELPVVLITGYSTAIARARGFPLLRKPCSPELLIATLQRALDQAAARPRVRR